jgi:hypothetical protein
LIHEPEKQAQNADVSHPLARDRPKFCKDSMPGRLEKCLTTNIFSLALQKSPSDFSDFSIVWPNTKKHPKIQVLPHILCFIFGV